jgi:hypothetical protein
VNYPQDLAHYNQLFYPACSAGQDPTKDKCNEQNNPNYGKAIRRQDPRLLRVALKVSF